jgi:hypothetical protein
MEITLLSSSDQSEVLREMLLDYCLELLSRSTRGNWGWFSSDRALNRLVLF